MHVSSRTIPANSIAEFYIPAGYSVKTIIDRSTGEKVGFEQTETNYLKLKAGIYQIDLVREGK